MVMHARKPQRIGDGYFEKHQTHPYQNSKYSSSKGHYDRDRMRERDSPNGNSYRSESPECDSPRDRGSSYHSKAIYLSKSREKERENRDYKSRDKYADCVRSPKDKRNRESRDSEHRTNHDRNSTEKVVLHTVKITTQNSSRETSQRKLSTSCQDKREERERVLRVGDWSEHLSSSGKKYYYNCKTEVSQWEKPREWLDPRPQSRHNYPAQSNRTVSDKHSNSRSLVGSSAVKTSSGSLSSRTEKTSSGSYWPNTQHETPAEVRKQQELTNSTGGTDGQADMEICSGDSTPTSETSYSTGGVVVGGGGGGGGGVVMGGSVGGPVGSIVVSMTPSVGVVEAAPSANAPGPPTALVAVSSTAASSTAAITAAAAALLPTSVSLPPQAVPPPQVVIGGVGPIHVDTSTTGHVQDTGPPTPTHSETQDCTDARKLLSPPSSLSSLQSLAGGSSLAAIRPQAPNLTPSLANHYRDDLVNHVRGWPADVLEKQAQKLGEEAHSLGSLCTRVSAELKCARSIVRLTEIQATLQEQRVLFLRQQIKNLEELKSQNSFMADEA